jgi:hypothetical protein
MLESARKTAVGDFEVVAVFDADDEKRELYPPTKQVVRERPVTGGRLRTSGLWDVGWRAAKGDIAMLAADDITFETKGWDKAVEAVFDMIPDRLVMVYPNTNTPRQAPFNPFVSREWIDAVGEFTPDDYEGWFADEWIWSMAAEIRRVVSLKDVVVLPNQTMDDQTYADGMAARAKAGGLEGMRARFYSMEEVARRDARIGKLKLRMTSQVDLVPDPEPVWFTESIVWAARNRKVLNPSTLIVVHCFQGDEELVRRHLPVYLHHGCPVMVLSPIDSPVKIDHPGVECRSAGHRAYYGQDSLDRQYEHLKILLGTPFDFFLLNDADSMCLSPKIPGYLYLPNTRNTVWSNIVGDWRTHPSKYPKVAMQPPYFTHRDAIEKMLQHADGIVTDPITPYIDWYMVALTEEAGVERRTFPDGASFPAWRRENIRETQQLGHDFKHQYVTNGRILGDTAMQQAVLNGAVFIHAIKHDFVFDMLRQTYADVAAAQNRTNEPRVSILVPLRPEDGPEGEHRVKAWRFVERQWRRMYPNAQIVIGDDDGGEPYSKSNAVNDAYRKSSGDVLVVADADSWLEKDVLDKAIEFALERQCLVVPWAKVWRLGPEGTKKLLRSRKKVPEITDEMKAESFEGPNPITAGTLFVIRRDAFERVQGMDPRFRGWGFEDIAFRRACDTLLPFRTRYWNGEVISLYHPRPEKPQRGRVWANDEGLRGKELGKLYAQCEQFPLDMWNLVVQHPLWEGAGPIMVPPQARMRADEPPAEVIREQVWGFDESIRI